MKVPIIGKAVPDGENIRMEMSTVGKRVYVRVSQSCGDALGYEQDPLGKCVDPGLYSEDKCLLIQASGTGVVKGTGSIAGLVVALVNDNLNRRLDSEGNTHPLANLGCHGSTTSEL